jgi:hypothetical protein
MRAYLPVYIIMSNKIAKSRKIDNVSSQPGVHDVLYKMFFMTN